VVKKPKSCFVSTMKTFTLAIALLVEVTADANFRRLAMEDDDAEPEDPWMDIFENTRGMNVGRKIYEYLSLEDMENMIKLRPSRANYHEIFPVYKRKLYATYSEARIASSLEALAPLHEGNLYSFVTKIQTTRSRDVRQLAAQANGGGSVLAELAKMVLTDKIRKIIEMISSWFQDEHEELDVEDDPIILETIHQVRDALRRSEFDAVVDVLSFPLHVGKTQCGYISISFDGDGKLAVEYNGWSDYEVFSPSRADIITRRWTKKLAADVLEKLKEARSGRM